ncbi:MAG: flagellar hook-length control protein FliK [Planctomycetota bacterium]|jgi:flagellar hook-length control protein FliK
MGNSASLPSLEGSGRPFGTERSPLSPIRRPNNESTDPKGPVDRLSRDVEAGGRRRARRNESGSGREGRRGERPGEARERRNEGTEVSRREKEAQGRANQRSSQSEFKIPVQATSGSNVPKAQAIQSQSEIVAGPNFKLTAKTTPSGLQAEAGPFTSKADSDGTVFGFGLVQNQAHLKSGRAASALRSAGIGGSSTGAVKSAAEMGVAHSDRELQSADKQSKGKKTQGALQQTETQEAKEAQRAAQVVKQFRMQIHPGLRSATVHLSPAELGRLSIRLQVDGEEMRAMVRAESEETLDTLERHVHELEAAFADQGFEQMEFEFVLDQEPQRGQFELGAGRDVSNELEQLVDNTFTPEERIRLRSNDLGVDTLG